MRALDRYEFEMRDGHLVLLGTYSVGDVDGTGAQREDQEVHAPESRRSTSTGIESWLYPVQPPS